MLQKERKQSEELTSTNTKLQRQQTQLTSAIKKQTNIIYILKKQKVAKNVLSYTTPLCIILVSAVILIFCTIYQIFMLTVTNNIEAKG